MHIVDQQSVLGIVDAWLAHRAQGGDDLLVVVHPLDDGQLGWDVRGHAVRRGTVTVDLATIVQRRFGATDLDPRVRQNRWLVEGLLDAEPTVGWRRGGPVLTLDVAVRALLAARLGFDDPPDAGTLLDWSRGPGPARFRALPAEERAGLTAWLCGTVGGVAAVLMALVIDGRAADAMALGIVAAVLDEPRASAETAVAVGGLLGATRIDPAERRAFVAAVEGTLERWVSAAEDGGASGEDARRRVLAVVDRADRLAADAGPHRCPGGQRLPALGVPGAAAGGGRRAHPGAGRDRPCRCGGCPRCAARAPARAAASRPVRGRGDGRAPAPVARDAARNAPDRSPRPSATQVAEGGWVDRALTAVWAGESADDPVVAAGLPDGVRRGPSSPGRRRRRLRGQPPGLGRPRVGPGPGGALLIEQVLEEVAVPLLAVGPAPLVVVVDGMSAAVAAELGEQLAERAWIEVTRESGTPERGGRDGALGHPREPGEPADRPGLRR